ncbi:MAG: COX15/CtaA family protein [Vulcanimicrobiaceae bacterium]
MRSLRRMALVAIALAFGTVLLGSWTRINGAGMTCPGWPLCHGKLIPSFADGTIWEWLHRLFAFAIAPVVLVVIVAAWRLRRRNPSLTPTVFTVGALFIVQVLLGAATVRLQNSPLSVMLHWATAMAFTAGLVAIAVFADESAVQPRERNGFPVWIPLGVATIALATMCVGAYVSSSGAGLACLSIPGCAGNIGVYTPGEMVQMLHRAFAAATLLASMAGVAAAFVYHAGKRVQAAMTIGVVLVFVQVLLGFLNVVLRLPMDLREAHAGNAALLFLAFSAATFFAVADEAPAVTPSQTLTAS